MISTPVFAQEYNSTEKINGLENQLEQLTVELKNTQNHNMDLETHIGELEDKIVNLEEHGIKFGIDEEKLGIVITDHFPKNEKDWTNGDALIASSTIIAFFTLGSFLVIKFESDKRPHQLKILRVVFKLILVIQLIHISAMILIMTGDFTGIIYAVMLAITGYLLLLILIGVTKIIELENREQTKTVETTKSYDVSKEYFDELREKLRKEREAGE